MYSFFVFFEKAMKFFRIHLKKCYWKLKYGKRIKIGKNLKFRSDFRINIAKNGYLQIGDGCFFNNHIFNDKIINIKTSFKENEIIIGNNNWFASNVIVLSKAAVNDNCVFGANTIINEKFNSGSLVRTQSETSITKIHFKGQ